MTGWNANCLGFLRAGSALPVILVARSVRDNEELLLVFLNFIASEDFNVKQSS